MRSGVAGAGWKGQTREVPKMLEYKGIAAETQRGVMPTRTCCSAARKVTSHKGDYSCYLQVSLEYQGCLTSEDMCSEVQGILADP